MKLHKIYDGDIQCFQIKSPSAAFKKRFPNRFIYVISIFGKSVITGNANTLPTVVQIPHIAGYVFTYLSTMPAIRPSKTLLVVANATYPTCLDQFFPSSTSKEEDEIDIVVGCIPRAKVEVPPTLCNKIYIRGNSLKLTGFDSPAELIEHIDDGAKTFRENVIERVNKNMLKFDNIEHWIQHIVDVCPLADGYKAIVFPKDIEDKDVKNGTVERKHLFISYDYRPFDLKRTSYDYENSLSVCIENAFEDDDLKLVIRNNYNDIVKRMLEELKKNDKLKYEYDAKEDKLTLTFATLRKIHIEYELTDFI